MTQSPIALDTPLALPCGAVLPNRLAKPAMTEGLADPQGRAGKAYETLYRTWGKGGTGVLITGNIQIDRRSLERAGNIRIEGPHDHEQMRGLAAMAAAAQEGGAHIWAQISHGGRQAPAEACPEPVAPSAVPMTMLRWTQRAPRALQQDEIEDLIWRFANAAAVCKDAGFNGVEIHGAHGYLISEFLSPLVNRRTDQWGGSLENRARFLLHVIRATRKAVGADFPIAVKLNSADFQQGGFSHDDSLRVVEWLNDEGIDLLEITGGTYERLSMIGVGQEKEAATETRRASTEKREAYFASYAADARKVAKMPVMATGGFRRRDTILEALNNGTCDLVGLGRPLCTEPDISARLIDGSAQKTRTLEYELALSETEESDLTPEEIQTSTILGQQALFFLTLFDMSEGKAPNTERSLVDAQAELNAREERITAALLAR